MQFTFFFKDHLEIQKQPLEVFCKKCPQACNFIIKRLQHRCFPVKYTKLLRRPILKNICKWLLLLNELSVPKALTFLEIQVLIQDVLKYHCFRLIEVLSFQFLNLCKICDDQLYCLSHTSIRGTFNQYAQKVFSKVTFLTPLYTHVRVHIKG